MQKSPENRPLQPARFALRMAAIALLTSIMPVTPTMAQAPGYVRVKLLKGGLLFGAGGGSGTVTYRGRDYPFTVSGLSLGFTAGVSYVRFKGWATGIRKIDDFAGTYSLVGSGGAVMAGIGGVQLVNGKGVMMALRGPRMGVELATNLGQVTIELKE